MFSKEEHYLIINSFGWAMDEDPRVAFSQMEWTNGYNDHIVDYKMYLIKTPLDRANTTGFQYFTPTKVPFEILHLDCDNFKPAIEKGKTYIFDDEEMDISEVKQVWKKVEKELTQCENCGEYTKRFDDTCDTCIQIYEDLGVTMTDYGRGTE